MGRGWEIATAVSIALLCTLALILRYNKLTRIPHKSLAEWMRELGILLKHRVPISSALVASAEDAHEKVSNLSYRLRKSISEGATLSFSLAQELALPQSVLATIAAGEVYGTLPEALIDASELLLNKRGAGIGPQTATLRTESEQEQQRIHEVAESVAGEHALGADEGEDLAPLIRIAHSILAQAIRSGAEYVELEPVRTLKPPKADEFQDEEEWRLMEMEMGPQLLITFAREGHRWEAMRIPKSIVAPLYRCIKIMAEVPYWQKPPVAGRIAVKLEEKAYDMFLDTESHPLGEKLRLEIREAE